MEDNVLFVSGIDTGIGKSYATAMLLRYGAQMGRRVISQKPVQTGCVGRSEDLDAHDALVPEIKPNASAEPFRCSYLFKYPASPHLAAQLEGVTIDPAQIDRDTNSLLQLGYDWVIMEGAGGLMVPLTPDLLTIDFIAQRHYPVALVSSGRLGSINHTLLSCEALAQRDIPLHYLIYNQYPAEESPLAAETLRYLQTYLHRYSPQTEWLDLQEMQAPYTPTL